MASTFDWIKLGLENSKVVLPIMLLLISATGYTFNDNMNMTQEIKDSQDQLTTVANYYSKRKPATIKQVISCGSCEGLIEQHKKEHH